MADSLEIYGISYTGVNGFKASNGQNTLTYIRPQGTITITDNGTSDCSAYAAVTVAIPTASGVSF